MKVIVVRVEMTDTEYLSARKWYTHKQIKTVIETAGVGELETLVDVYDSMSLKIDDETHDSYILADELEAMPSEGEK